MAARFFSHFSVLFLLMECAVCAKFSSRLIHRFSDEVKAIRSSRSKGWWPEKRSLAYYRMLVDGDLERQKTKLGPQHHLLFPSEGSLAMSLGNDFGWLHYTWIDIGTPNVSFLVALDTGSDLLWVPCNCVRCAPLSASSYDILDRDLSEYNPSGSTTSKHLHCSHQLCELGRQNCKSPEHPCPYSVSYYSEGTSSSGFLVEDLLHFASQSDDEPSKSVRAQVIIGCGSKQSGGYLEGVAPDGLMGLGLGEISVPSFLSKAGLTRNSFSLCFDETDSGRILFGDQGSASQQTTPFLPLDDNYVTYIVGVEAFCVGSSCPEQANFRALVDSGTSFTFLPHLVYGKVVEEFDGQVNATKSSHEEYPWKFCYDSSNQVLPKIPSVALKFGLNNSFVVHNPVFVFYGNQGVAGFCLAIQAVDGDVGIIGQNFMRGYRMVFDRENLKLGWSSSNCQELSDEKRLPSTPPSNGGGISDALPTTDQQSTPTNGLAVPPAVAGRTPSNSVASSICQSSYRPSWLAGFLLVLLQQLQMLRS